MTTTERVPPQSLEAEMSVLGAILLDERKIADAMVLIKAHYFYHEKHRVIFLAMQALFARSEPVDLMTLKEELKKAGKLAEIGESVYLAALVSSVATAANLGYYAGILKDKYELRTLIIIGREMQELAHESAADANELIIGVEKGLQEISIDKNGAGFVSVLEMADSAKSRAEILYNTTDLLGIPTGFSLIDRQTQGLMKTDLIIIAGRPGMGKTSLMDNMAVNIAATKKGKPGIFTIEMSAKQMFDRLAYSHARVSQRNFDGRRPTYQEHLRVLESIDYISSLDIHIDETPAVELTVIRAKAARLVAKGKIDIIFIDYLQLINGVGKMGNKFNREQEISGISRQLKALAKTLDVPVVCLSQLNRSCETRAPKEPRPMLSDLRESGAIEQDADMVMLMYRPEYYKGKDTPIDETGIAIIDIAKQRNGPTGAVKLTFVDKYTQFSNYTQNEPPANWQEAGE